ncbi:MAG: GNAT family N-acetyltransferase [Gammaproteobacteria bacterium]|nr:GNAT family N-acetyltransferase [Gammaproteobacteria bacterium]
MQGKAVFHPANLDRDLELCVEFRRDSFRSSFPGSDQWQQYWNEQDYRQFIVSHAERFPDGLLHLWQEQKIIGQLEFAYIGDNGHVNLFYLLPEYRGKGYGDLLHDRAVTVLREKGCTTASLRVAPSNARAIGFYKKYGWQNQGIDQHYDFVHMFILNL